MSRSAPSESRAAAPPCRVGAAARRILVVDPDGDGSALAAGLARAGYVAALAASVGRARHLLAAQPFAALVTDLALPGGGRRWLAELRAVRPRLSVMVVAAQPLADLGLDRLHGLADAVLAKPAEPQVVTAILDRVLDGRGVS